MKKHSKERISCAQKRHILKPHKNEKIDNIEITKKQNIFTSHKSQKEVAKPNHSGNGVIIKIKNEQICKNIQSKKKQFKACFWKITGRSRKTKSISERCYHFEKAYGKITSICSKSVHFKAALKQMLKPLAQNSRKKKSCAEKCHFYQL